MALSESHSAAGAHTHPAEHRAVALRLHRDSGWISPVEVEQGWWNTPD